MNALDILGLLAIIVTVIVSVFCWWDIRQTRKFIERNKR